jgi:hypothetical protein
VATIVLVCANAATPTAGDLVIQGRLEAAGHTVVRTSDESAEYSGAYDGVFVSDSCSGGTFGSKYDTVAKPAITCEAVSWRLGTYLGGITGTQWTVQDVAGNGGLTGTQSVYSNSQSQQGIDTDVLPGAATVVARLAGDADHGTYVTYEAGGALTSGTAPARRVFLRIGDGAMDNLTAAGTTLLDAAISWAFGPVAPDDPPGAVFDLENWKLTLPTGTSGADEVRQPELDTYADDGFYVDAQNRMVMVAPTVGATTGGSSSTRREFREMQGGVEAGWDAATTGFRQLTVTAIWDPTSIPRSTSRSSTTSPRPGCASTRTAPACRTR